MKNMIKNNLILILFSVVMLSFIIRVIGFLVLTNWHTDVRMEEFHHIARHIVAGNGFSFTHNPLEITVPSAYMPPGYPYLMAGLIYIMGDNTVFILTILVLQAIVGALIAIPIFLIAERIFNRKVAIISVLLSFSYPIYQLYTCDYTSTPYYILFSLLMIHFLLRLREEYKELFDKSVFLYAGLGGLFFGLWVAFRGEALLFLPVPFLIILQIKKWRAILSISSFFLVCFLIVMGPWWVRNHVVFGEWVLTPTAGKYTLFRGQNRLATGGAYGPWMGDKGSDEKVTYHSQRQKSHEFQNPDSDPEYAVHPPEVVEKFRNMGPLPQTKDYELKLEERYFQEAISFMRNNPLKSFKLALIKFKYFWWRDETHPVSHHPAYYIPWGIMLPFFVIGIMLNFRALLTNEKWMLYIFLCQTLICMVFLVQPRYRIFLDPFIFMFVASALSNIYNYFHRGSSTSVSSVQHRVFPFENEPPFSDSVVN